MIQVEETIQNKLGLHARAAAKFVKCASQYACGIQVRKDAMTVNGKSIIGVLLLAAPKGSTLLIIAEGVDESVAVEALGNLIRDRFGEE